MNKVKSQTHIRRRADRFVGSLYAQESYFYKVGRLYIAPNKGNRDEIQSMSTTKSDNR